MLYISVNLIRESAFNIACEDSLVSLRFSSTQDPTITGHESVSGMLEV